MEMTCKNIIRWFKQQNTLSLSPAPEASFLMELLELEMISAVFFLELLVPVWAGASNHRIPAKRQIIFQIELSENSVENARKTADFGIELSENFNRWPGPTLLCLHSLVHGLSEPKGFSPISHREKKWIGKESESENRAIPTEFARNSRVFFFSN